MSNDFDPYHRWLGIHPKHLPADRYRLLGIELLEADPEAIRDAAERQSGHVRRYALGQHSVVCQRILNEIGAAKACLLDEEVARRWWNLFPGRKTDDDKPAEPEPHELQSSRSRETSVNDARYQGIITIEYPLHPLFGCQFEVARRLRYGRLLFFEINLGGKLAAVPEWMTRRDLCSQLRCGVDPVCSWTALRRIRALLDQREV